jgi:ATP-binding cassette subfamily F protein 3
MLTAHHIYKSYNLDVILEDISFSIVSGERVGLIGPNGCGKTTLLRILAGMDAPDQGHVSRLPIDLSIGYLPQSLEIDPNITVGQLLRSTRIDSEILEGEVAHLATEITLNPDSSKIQNAYDEALRRLHHPELNFNSYLPGETASILKALGLETLVKSQPIYTLSGGQKTRLSLALVLRRHPQLLLLDEPTNHLDIAMLEWVENWILSYSGGAIIVSHDRTFLDRTVTRILYLDPVIHNLSQYHGNYSTYLKQSLAERNRQVEAYRDQVEIIRRMRRDINRTKQQAVRVEQTTTSRQPGIRRIAKKVARKASARQKKLERYLKSDELQEKLIPGWQMKLEFDRTPEKTGSPHHLGQDVISMMDLSIGYQGYPTLLQDLNLLIKANRHIAFTGPNGSGKTTLLRTIAGQIPPISGKIRLGASVRLGYMPQEQELLDPRLNAMEVLQAKSPLNETEVRSFLHYFLFSGDDALRPVFNLSFGEKARLILATLVVEGCNFLMLDEPINHLDIPSRTRFEQALAHFHGAILAVVHDRYFIECFATDYWFVENNRVRHEIITT